MDKISVRKSYAGKSVLVTGATGFIGKVLVEKLLYDVDDIKTIFIFFRAKRGYNFYDRFDKFKSSKIFDRVKLKNTSLLDKIVPINADLCDSPNLGIPKADLNTLKKEVGFVFHLAATVKFNEPVEVALKLNMIATRNLINISKSFENLQAFVYVSTTYSNCHVPKIEESIHKPVYDFKKALDAMDNLDSEELTKLNEVSLEYFPNTYTFSKHLTEQLINGYSHEIPIVICRPSIVTPSYKEPYEGWIDNFKSFMALSAGIANGLIRVCYMDKNFVKSDFIPCDFTSNSIIVSAAEIVSSEDKSMRIVNCTMGKQFPNSFLQLANQLLKLTVENFPSDRMIWYPNFEHTSIYPIYLLKFFLFQFLPAMLIDFVLILMFKKPFMVKLQKMIFKALDGFHYFIWNQWTIENDNFIQLHGKLCDEEKEIFNIDLDSFDEEQCKYFAVNGTRKFLLKQDDSTIPASYDRLLFFYFLDKIVKILFWCLIAYFVIKLVM